MHQITSHGEPIKIPYDQIREIGLDGEFVNSFIKHLDQEEVIELISLGRPFAVFTIFGEETIAPDEYHYAFKLTVTFDQFYKKKISELAKNGTNAEIKNSSEFTLKISYSENAREIILNDFFVISKPDFNSENEQVFYYLYRNPNRLIEKSEIEENFKANQTLTKDFNKIVENLKFKKDLRKAFFDISQNSIKFYNPVSKERLHELGIKNIPIEIK